MFRFGHNLTPGRVIVGIVLLVAIVGGVFLWRRMRRGSSAA